MPKGCGIKEQRDPKNVGNWLGQMNCEKQDLLDEGEKGKTLYERVKIYSLSPSEWYEDYVKALAKVQSNGYNDEDLVEGPNNFWSHPCCFESSIEWDTQGRKDRPYNKRNTPVVKDALECQKLCQQSDKCKYFRLVYFNYFCYNHMI